MSTIIVLFDADLRGCQILLAFAFSEINATKNIEIIWAQIGCVLYQDV